MAVSFGVRSAAAGVMALLAMSVCAQTPSDTEARLAMDVGGRTLVRTVEGRKEWVYQWPAVYFESHFKGSSVSLRFDDANNNFNVLVDGQETVVKRPGRISMEFGDLGSGSHTIRLEKVTETREATGAFVGFFVPHAQDALPATVSPKRIEFIGDSLTVGFGNTSAFGTCSKEELFETTNAQESFGPLTAKHFNAEYRVEAFSGLGLVRNAGGTMYPQYSLPILWPRTLFDDKEDEATAWSPQILVIGIGGNDFTPFHENERWKTQAAMAADYEKNYVAFVKGLRKSHPDALIIMTWTSDKSPEYERSAERVFAELKAEGMTDFDRMVFPKMQRTGCMDHPNIHDDAEVARLLEALIDSHPEAWQSR